MTLQRECVDLIDSDCASSRASFSAVFATPPHCLSEASGGQQLYTRELLETLRIAGIQPQLCPIPFSRKFGIRVLRRVWPRPYRYNYSPSAVTSIAQAVAKSDAVCVLLNGATFLGIAKSLREALPDTKLVMLSHGLDSTDYVHTIRTKDCDGGSPKIRSLESSTLGRQLVAECSGLQELDATLGLSEIEAEINRWLGAKHSFWMPRAVRSNRIDWRPQKHRVGFVGTLDHPPNREGLHRILRVVNERRLQLTIRLAGGPERLGVEFATRYPCVDYLGTLNDEELTREACSWRALLHPVFCFARGASMKLATGIGWGIPIVATTAGRRGYQWNSGSLIEANSPETFVDQACRLASDDAYMHEIRRQVLEIANSTPTPEANSNLLREHLAAVLAGR